MTERNESKFARLFTRDGHLTELTVNRVVSGELSGDESAQVDEHVAGCEPCAARIEAVRAFDASFSIAPPPGLGEDDDGSDEVVSLAEEREKRRPTGLIVFGAVAAAAAAVLIALNIGGGPEPARVQPGDGIRTKGSSVAMTVFAKSDDGKVRQLGNGDVVHPGDRLGFEVKSTEDGYLLLAGVDSAGQVYPVYPQTDGRAEKVEGTAEKRALEAAIRLDDVGTSERLVAMRCPEGFAFDEAIDALKRQREGDEADEEDPFAECVYSEVTLKKEPK
jgi:hypothetical protein